MTYQMKSIKVLRTSAVAAVLYFILSFIIVIPIFLLGSVLSSFQNSSALPMLGMGVVIFILPFVYGILGFILSVISCLLYNLVAKFMGGIAFTLEEIK